MPLCRWSFASMLVHLEEWISEFTQHHIVVQTIIRGAQKENISLQTLLDCAVEINKDYVSRNSLCFITDDVPVAQILEICSGMATELSGVRELLIQNGMTIKHQQRELKEFKVNQLETHTHLKNVQDTILTLQNQLLNDTTVHKRKNPPIDVSTFTASDKRSKVRFCCRFYDIAIYIHMREVKLILIVTSP